MTETRKLRVFLCHATQDKPVVRELYQRLLAEGWVDPWLDSAKLLPGQHWSSVIRETLNQADSVIIFVSNSSIDKEGFVQREMNYAWDKSLEKPRSVIYLIPLRLEECDVPYDFRERQWADYFGERKEETYTALLASLKVRYEQKLRQEAEEKIRHEKEEQTRKALEERTRREVEKQERLEKEERERKYVEEKTRLEIEDLAQLEKEGKRQKLVEEEVYSETVKETQYEKEDEFPIPLEEKGKQSEVISDGNSAKLDNDSELVVDSSVVLNTARNFLNRGIYREAVQSYSYLINIGEFLSDIQKDLHYAISRDAENIYIWSALGEVEERLGNYSRAEFCYKQSSKFQGL